MDHGNTKAGQQYKQCPHGMCLNHDPEWENIGKKRRQYKGEFPGKTSGRDHCCGKAMMWYKEVQKRRCKKCGRTEDHISNYYLALCLCCNYHFIETPSYDG